MNRVRARLRDGVVDHAGGLTELRREAVGDHLHFTHQHFGNRQQAQAGAILLGVRVAIELIVRVHLRTVRVDARHAELVVLVAGDVGLKEGEVVRIARRQRQVVNFDVADGAAEVDLARLRDRRFSGDRHGLADGADRQREVDGRGVARAQRNAGLLRLLETLQFGRRPGSVPSGSSRPRYCRLRCW